MKRILVMDIETVGMAESYQALSPVMQSFWDQKAKYWGEEATPEQQFEQRAGIYAEFGKIIVIGLGILTIPANGLSYVRLKTIADHDESKLLNMFVKLLEKLNPTEWTLCAHNGKEFDFPYLCRRLLIHGYALPGLLNVAGKKPWEVPFMDTMDLWKFGDRKSYTSLDLLATLFGLESSKSTMQGSEVHAQYYQHRNLEKIAAYCQEDVRVTAQLYCKLMGVLLPTIEVLND